MKRRKFIDRIAKAGLVGTLPLPSQNLTSRLSGRKQEPFAFLTEPYLQYATPTAISIMWICSTNGVGWIEISDGQATRTVINAQHGLNRANERIMKVRIESLKPGTTYQYWVTAKEIKVFEPYEVTFGETIRKGPYRFTTPSDTDEAVSFVVFNDLHNHPANIPELLDKHAAEGTYDFVVFNGDTFNWVDSEQPILNDFLIPCGKAFSTSRPFLMVQGNHEVRGNYARQFFDYFDYPDDRTYYAFSRGPVRFIVLDCGEDKEDEHPVYAGLVAFDAYRQQQAQWLAREIESEDFKKAAFRVVFIHIPTFHAGSGHGTLHCRELFNPLLNKGKIDIAISGHTHRYGTFDPDPVTHHYPIVIGGGPGFEGRGGGARTLIKVHATRQTLTLQLLIDDGTVAGSYELRK